MIAEYLDREFVISQLEEQRAYLMKIRRLARSGDTKTVKDLKKHGIKLDQLDLAINALNASKKRAEKESGENGPFIPRDIVTCNLQAGLTEIASSKKNKAKRSASEPALESMGGGGIDTSSQSELKSLPGPAIVDEALEAPFVEGEDIHYGLDGFVAKFGALFRRRRKFNKKPARVVSSNKPLRLFVFGDWGSGLPLARMVTKQIGRQLKSAGGRQQHVIHLGDVYYVGDSDEYKERVFPLWPVTPAKKATIGSWSLNGNHDMYNGGYGYFDTLLKHPQFLRWHADESGKPSSFFMVEDAHWQVFGLDTSWNTPSLSSAIIGKPTLKDYGGMNGYIDKSQARFMARQRDPNKGCILLSHHQPAGSRHDEKQHSDAAIKLLREVGVYKSIDAWLWGHEHRAVVFRPKAERKHRRLKSAPAFCACIGHAGVPVTDKNFDAKGTISDVLWQEDGRGANRPIYEGDPVMPFGFARIETRKDAFDFRIFDHDGNERYSTVVNR